MTTKYADARPTRRFFIEMLTVDINLEDAILDLVDNAIDALCRNRKLDLSEKLLLSDDGNSLSGARVSIQVNEREISVEDTCGGIERNEALSSMFRIGKIGASHDASLGVYGIGLKRAIFKMGNSFELVSKRERSGFVASLDDIDAWAEDDSSDWKIPTKDATPAKSVKSAGTKVKIWNLRDPIKRRIREGTLLSSLTSAISRTYPFLLNKFVRVSLNGNEVEPESVPVAGSEQIAPAVAHLLVKDPEVRVTLIAGIASLHDAERSIAKAGWYIVCNGRVVISADKSELTGWGAKLLPQFHDKYRPFIGIAFFFSAYPLALPWTTTKRQINRDSVAFLTALPHMATATRQVLPLLNRMYPGEPVESPPEREAVSSVIQLDVRQLARSKPSSFKADIRKTSSRQTTRVQYDVTMGELERARRCLKQPRWSGTKVGRYAFDYLLRNECGNG